MHFNYILQINSLSRLSRFYPFICCFLGLKVNIIA